MSAKNVCRHLHRYGGNCNCIIISIYQIRLQNKGQLLSLQLPPSKDQASPWGIVDTVSNLVLWGPAHLHWPFQGKHLLCSSPAGPAVSQIGRKTDGLINTGFWLGCYGLAFGSKTSCRYCFLPTMGLADVSLMQTDLE